MTAEQMTLRTRLYLSGAAVRHALLGVALLLVPAAFNPAAYRDLFAIAPKWVWIATLLFGAAHLGYAAATGSEANARFALVVGSGLSVMWATAFLLIVRDGIPAATASILFADLAWKDLVICAGPLRNPLAPAIRAARSDEVV
jgi:hypothetical protein